MDLAAIVCNLVLTATTGLILLTEGIPGRFHYILLSALMFAVPLASAIVVYRARQAGQQRGATSAGPTSTSIRRTALLNVVLFVAACWSAIAQYPYPEGNTVIPFAVLTVLVPVLNLLSLRGAGNSTTAR